MCSLQEFLYALCGQENVEVLVWDIDTRSLLTSHKASFTFYAFTA